MLALDVNVENYITNDGPQCICVIGKFYCEYKIDFFLSIFHLQLTLRSANWKSVKSVHGLHVAISHHRLLLLHVAVLSGVGNINTVTQNELESHHSSSLLQPTWLFSTFLIIIASVSVRLIYCDGYRTFPSIFFMRG